MRYNLTLKNRSNISAENVINNFNYYVIEHPDIYYNHIIAYNKKRDTRVKPRGIYKYFIVHFVLPQQNAYLLCPAHIVITACVYHKVKL